MILSMTNKDISRTNNNFDAALLKRKLDERLKNEIGSTYIAKPELQYDKKGLAMVAFRCASLEEETATKRFVDDYMRSRLNTGMRQLSCSTKIFPAPQ